jgi:hypothetical protein
MTGEGQLRESEDRLAGIQSRILFHEDAIGALLAHDLLWLDGPRSLDGPVSGADVVKTS